MHLGDFSLHGKHGRWIEVVDDCVAQVEFGPMTRYTPVRWFLLHSTDRYIYNNAVLSANLKIYDGHDSCVVLFKREVGYFVMLTPAVCLHSRRY